MPAGTHFFRQQSLTTFAELRRINTANRVSLISKSTQNGTNMPFMTIVEAFRVPQPYDDGYHDDTDGRKWDQAVDDLHTWAEKVGMDWEGESDGIIVHSVNGDFLAPSGSWVIKIEDGKFTWLLHKDFCGVPVGLSRHKKRGSSYYVLAKNAMIQCSSGVLKEDDLSTVYIQMDHNPMMFVRKTEEFDDGRFVTLEEAPKPLPSAADLLLKRLYDDFQKWDFDDLDFGRGVESSKLWKDIKAHIEDQR